ncbi:site-specific integrase [Cohnella sp. LGH]|uniref:tyrosine-type recombinase/integrase n=1 Tax=Cohnella sp. LGH TaxID=1619153 RepID=UPI001ADCEFF3|nr:site-specific integrase [Cohnella sp. LGH]QTH44917.1 site-specific integrase [Cohnella sp. LGH]
MPRKRKDDEYPGVRKRGKGYTYRYDIPIVKPDGKPGRKQTDTPQYPTALEAYQAGVLIEAELIKGTFVDPINASFDDWSTKGLEMYAKAKNLKSKTIVSHTSNLSHARKYFKGKKFKDIESHEYQNYLFYLRDDLNLKNNTISMYHSSAKLLWGLAVSHKMIAVDITENVTPPKHEITVEQLISIQDDELPEYLEKEQLASLLRTIKLMESEQQTTIEAFAMRQLFRAVYVLSNTGLRVGELCALVPDRIDKRKKEIVVAATLNTHKGYSGHHLGTPKNSKLRRVGVVQSVIEMLDSQITDVKAFKLSKGTDFYSGPLHVFVGYKEYPGWPLITKELGTGLREALTRAELPTSITPHKLRHTYASLCAEAGMPLEDIQTQLGHASDKMTRLIYTHVTEARRKANVDKLELLLSPLIHDI